MTAVEVRSEPLTYERDAPHSYFRDLIVRGSDRSAAGRLAQHAAEMRVEVPTRDLRASRALGAAGFETRAAPSRVAGNGGDFAPPLWLVDAFATAPRPHRVLADLAPGFPLPAGVSSVNIPILTTGTATASTMDNAAVGGRDIVDSSTSSTVVAIDGQADVALQLLEQSPTGAHLDWALFKDMTEDYDAKLEAALLNGSGVGPYLKGAITWAPAASTVTYSDGSPTGGEFYTALAQAAATVGDNRNLPPECWLMRTARWAWLAAAPDTTTLRPMLPPTVAPMRAQPGGGPAPVGGAAGWPVFVDDALPAALGAAANQDVALAVRPSDMMVFEAEPRTVVLEEPLSGTLGVRLQLRNYVAALIGRYSSGIGLVTGSGMIVQSGY